ncbi:MAG: pitrilysin family protein [Acidobacteria bacterium]|nr:pitrilysin family protein [Acidobacteriota bacterium]
MPGALTYTKTTLDNGLDVIVHEEHACPIVAVNLWYHVGSKNERPGRTGFAHLFEHLMFEGSEHHDAGYFRPLEEAGGTLNGSTNADRTNYWATVPREAVERALWLESDRMGYLLPALSAEKLATQRDVVLNERRQNYENRPYGMVSMTLSAAHFPLPHPYHWPTIGVPADLHAVELEDVREFFGAYYHPGNASLAIAGDIDTDEALALAGRHFGEISTRPPPPPAAIPAGPLRASDSRPRSLYLEDRVELVRIYLTWRTTALFEGGDAELDVLADLLAGGLSSRLHRALVRDRRLAVDVGAWQDSREIAGVFAISVTVAPTARPADVEAVVTDELARLADRGPDADELARVVRCAESAMASLLQRVGGFGGRSDQLNRYNVFAGTPGYLAGDLARYRRVDRSGVQAAAARLAPERRIALSVVPLGANDAALPGAERAEAS